MKGKECLRGNAGKESAVADCVYGGPFGNHHDGDAFGAVITIEGVTFAGGERCRPGCKGSQVRCLFRSIDIPILIR